MSTGRARTAACKARFRAGRRMVLVEIDEVCATEALIKKALLQSADAEDWKKVGEVISRVFAMWVDEVE
jgi:hypothetical protein